MKNLGIILGALLLLSLTFLGQPSNAHGQGLLLNEVEADAPDPATQFACQYVEVRGAPGSVVPANTYFASIQGSSGNFGDLQFVVSLGGRTVGSNGTISIINQLEGTCPGRTFPAGTTLVAIDDFDGLGLQDSGARTFAIFTSPTAPPTDIDTDNNRVIDPALGITIIDGFGFATNLTFQANYAPTLYEAATQADVLLPDAATRFRSNSTPLNAAAWYFGELASTPANTTTYQGTPRSTNFPDGGALTPGDANLPPGTVVPADAIVDFDGDGRTDFSIVRLSGNQAFWFNNLNGAGTVSSYQWGVSGDIPVAEDYDGDGKDDVAVWRPGTENVAAFYIIQSSNNTVKIVSFGLTGDDPALAGDWDGDGKADPAVYRNATAGQQSFFYYLGSSNNPANNITYLPWGVGNDQGVRGDFDGDDKQDAAVFRPSDNTWYIRQSSNSQLSAAPFGVASDVKLSGDFDGDNKTDLAVYRGGVWWIRQSGNGQIRTVTWGVAGDTPVPGDYDGDGSADFALWRSGLYYILSAGTGSVTYFNWGSTGDQPVASVFNN